MLYVATVMPYNVAFLDSEFGNSWYYIDLFIDFSFIFDVLINCVSAYYDEDGKLVSDNKKIITVYVKGWFLVDSLASFPFNLVERNIEQ